jgi:hypothetical protein
MWAARICAEMLVYYLDLLLAGDHVGSVYYVPYVPYVRHDDDKSTLGY